MSVYLGKQQSKSLFSIVPAARLSGSAGGLMFLTNVVDKNAKVLILSFLQKQSKLSTFIFQI